MDTLNGARGSHRSEHAPSEGAEISPGVEGVAKGLLGPPALIPDGHGGFRRNPDDGRPIAGVCVADVERERIAWLWPGRLALGKLTILDGDPGMGKSTLCAYLAACVTRGRPFPDEDVSTPGREPGSVLIVTTEDSVADTIRPRLECGGADLHRVHVIKTVPVRGDDGALVERVPVLPDDLDEIERAARRIGATLIIIDPLFAHLSTRTSSYKDQDVRQALAPLTVVAERLGAAVLVVRHLNKMAGGNAMYRGGGSIGIIGAARVGLLLGRDPEDETRLVLASVKNNVAQRPPSLAFRILSSPEDSTVSMIGWEGSVSLSADDLIRVPQRAPSAPARDEAVTWLQRALSNGPRPARELYDEAKAAGIPAIRLKRAKHALRVLARREGFGKEGGWIWTLPLSEQAGVEPPAAIEDQRGSPPEADPLWIGADPLCIPTASSATNEGLDASRLFRVGCRVEVRKNGTPYMGTITRVAPRCVYVHRDGADAAEVVLDLSTLHLLSDEGLS